LINYNYVLERSLEFLSKSGLVVKTLHLEIRFMDKN